ncbi:hypothetical protein ACQ4M3_13945 [Leptolyngbya sp. AN03gr2]|uniref:hypothetical protein n=1 Tax=unclassified Leptolyngbya TaxID=2650499 RepID=UPI003D31C480
MDIGIFGAFVLLLIMGWLPVVVVLLLPGIFGAIFMLPVQSRSSPRRNFLFRYFAFAAVVFTPLQVGFFRTAFYAVNPSEMSWIMTLIYSMLGVALFAFLSWRYRS